MALLIGERAIFGGVRVQLVECHRERERCARRKLHVRTFDVKAACSASSGSIAILTTLFRSAHPSSLALKGHKPLIGPSGVLRRRCVHPLSTCCLRVSAQQWLAPSPA